MKHLILTSALLLGGLSSFASNPQTAEVAIYSQTKQDNFKEIKVQDVPSAVLEAVKKSLPEGVVEKAYINDKKHYKLVVKTADKTSIIYSDASGNLTNN